MSPQSRNEVFRVIAYFFLAGAVSTLIPAAARIKNDLGYYSLCPFAPWSTLLLLLVAGGFGAIRTYMVSRTD